MQTCQLQTLCFKTKGVTRSSKVNLNPQQSHNRGEKDELNNSFFAFHTQFIQAVNWYIHIAETEFVARLNEAVINESI